MITVERKTIPIQVGQETLVGHLLSCVYPLEHGNCFGLIGAGHCVNMYVENFREWRRRTKTDTVEVVIFLATEYSDWVEKVVGRKACLIVDSRVPADWMHGHICHMCTSNYLIPKINEWCLNKEHEEGHSGD